MKTLYQKNVGKLGIIRASVSMSTLLEMLGRKRGSIAFHLWGKSKAGKAECEGEIEEAMTEWEEMNPDTTPYKANQHRIKVVQEVRKAKFELLEDEEQERWTKRAKSIHKPVTVEGGVSPRCSLALTATDA